MNASRWSVWVGVGLLLSPLLQAEPLYKADWDAPKFVSAVNQCRQQLLDVGAKQFADEMAAKGAGADAVHDGAIRAARMVDRLFTPACHCAISEAAKALSHAAYSADREALQRFLGHPSCADEMAGAQDPSGLEALYRFE